MTETSCFIKKYFCNLESKKINSVISQIESLSELTGEYLKADFTGLFYKQYREEPPILISFHNRSGIQLSDIGDFEKKYGSIENNFGDLLNKVVTVSPEDGFAQKNQFKYKYYQSMKVDDNLSVLVVLYWKDKPLEVLPENRRIVDYSLKLIHSIMEKNQDTRLLSDYSYRLSELLSMFEISVGEYNFNDLVNHLLEYAKNTISKFTYALFEQEDKKRNFSLAGPPLKPMPHVKFINDIIVQLIELDESGELESMPKGTLLDVSSNYDSFYSTVIISTICRESSKKIAMVAFSNEKGVLGKNNQELLSVFSLFANNILRDAVLLKRINKANRLLKKSSTQMADIETLAALTDMTSGVAHDFNNTIGGIIGRVQLLKLKTNDNAVLEGLEKIERLSLEGAATIKRIQEFTSGVKAKKLELIDIVETITDYFENPDHNWKKEAVDKKITIRFDNSISRAIINGSDSDIMIMIEKVLQNAVEHANPNSQIVVKFTDDNKYYIITITNFGKVIEEKHKSKIFYPFFTTKDEYGAGLGLSIVHGIVVRHGGKVSVDSSENKGTTFRITLPKPDKIEEESIVTVRKRENENLNILVVDDDEQIREVLSDMLTIEGYSITTCNDGPSAIIEYESGDYDLLITDLGMPGMSGLDLAGIIHEKDPEVPIAMITGWGTQLNVDEVNLKGVKSVLPKPFHLKDIKAMIEELVLNA